MIISPEKSYNFSFNIPFLWILLNCAPFSLEEAAKKRSSDLDITGNPAVFWQRQSPSTLKS